MSDPRALTHPVVAIVGATGTGKSQLAVDLALRFSGEVINGDAMQMYEGLPIITNKISLDERKGVPHHLLGCVSLAEPPWTVSNFVERASTVIRDIHARGKLPIIVGGTHYYLQSLLFNDSLAAAQVEGAKDQVDSDERRPEEKTTASQTFPILQGSTQAMLAKLQEIDPLMANRWHPSDHRKIRRSLEIWLKTGRRASDVYAEQTRRRAQPLGDAAAAASPGSDEQPAAEDDARAHAALRFPTLLLWTHSTRDVLLARLSRRVDAMLAAGLLGEVRALRARAAAQAAATDDHAPSDQTRGIWVSIGYKEFLPALDAASRTKEGAAVANAGKTDDADAAATAVALTNIATRQYAKRQVRWLRVKLLSALRAAGAAQRLVVLDTSEPALWDEQTLAQATRHVRAFVAGDHDVAQADSAALAELDLTAGAAPAAAAEAQDEKEDTLARRTCQACGVTCVTPNDWRQHVSSRRHRNALKSARRKGELQDPRRIALDVEGSE